MRAFIAIELPEDIRSALAALQEKLKTSGADVKWVEPQNIHLTLKFLGEIGDELKNKVCEALSCVAADNPPFAATINLIGGFPNIDYPRVIWVGIAEGDTQVKKIARELEDRLSKLGIAKEEHHFSSHITIGRVRSPSARKNLARSISGQAEYLSKENLVFDISKLTLFKSSLSPKGPLYEAQKEENLKTI